jgi:hypothetical protein
VENKTELRQRFDNCIQRHLTLVGAHKGDFYFNGQTVLENASAILECRRKIEFIIQCEQVNLF